MSEAVMKKLVNFAEKERDKIEPHFSAETACPGPRYKFDKSNPALGQCAVASLLAGEDFMILARLADGDSSLAEPLSAWDNMIVNDVLDSFPISNVEKQVIIQVLPSIEATFQNDKTFQAQAEGLKDKWAVFAYGDIFYGDEQLSDDHCWLRIVSFKEMFDPTAGYHLETTLDQFSTKELALPKGLVQYANPGRVEPMEGYDEPIRYSAKNEELIVLGARKVIPDGLYLTEERLARLKEEVNSKYRFWDKS